MNGPDFLEWRGKTQRISRSHHQNRQVRPDQLSALFGKRAESTAQQAHAAKWPKKAKDKQNSDRQQLIHSSKSMTKHGPIPVI